MRPTFFFILRTYADDSTLHVQLKTTYLLENIATMLDRGTKNPFLRTQSNRRLANANSYLMNLFFLILFENNLKSDIMITTFSLV